MTTMNPERYASAKLNIEDIVKSFSSTISKDSDKNLVSLYNSSRARKEAIDVIDEFYTKTREHGIMVYDSPRAAAKCIYRLCDYGNYLKARN